MTKRYGPLSIEYGVYPPLPKLRKKRDGTFELDLEAYRGKH